MEEISFNQNIIKTDSNISKPNSKKTIWITISIIAFVVIVGIVISSAIKSQPKNQIEISNCTISSSYSSYLGYSAYIRGKAKNTSNKNYSYVQLEFSVYDASGSNLGTALANINNLAAGDTWNFEATLFSFPNTQPVSYKLIDITAW